MSDTKIVVLTYDNPHRKSYDLLLRLKAKGYDNVTAIGEPWTEKKSFKPLIPHRPTTAFSLPHPKDLCERLGYRYEVRSIEEVPAFLQENSLADAIVLIGGSGILPELVLEDYMVVNSHPAYLPFVRGLDALKWGIYENLPIGVTVHRATAEADAGPFWIREKVPMYYYDTFHSFAQRQYDMEVSLLVEVIPHIVRGEEPEAYDVTDYIVRRRMPHSHELRLMDRFEKLRDETAIELASS